MIGDSCRELWVRWPCGIGPKTSEPNYWENPNTSFHTECWTCSYQHPQNFHPLPKVHIPLLSNVATKSKPKWILKKKNKNIHQFAQHASSYHRSRRRALSPVQPKRQPSRPPLLLNAPPLPSPANYAMWRRNVNSTPNLVPRWYRHERRRKKKKKTTTTRGNQRRGGDSKARTKSVGRFYSKGWTAEGARHPKVGPAPRSSFCFAKAWLIANSIVSAKLTHSLITPSQKLTLFDYTWHSSFASRNAPSDSSQGTVYPL